MNKENNKETNIRLNDIESYYLKLDNKLGDLCNQKLDLAFKQIKLENSNNLSKILYFIGIPVTFLSYTGLTMISNTYIPLNEILYTAGFISGLIIPFSLIINGPYLIRKKKIAKINNEINLNDKKIKELIDQIDEFNEKLNIKEKENNSPQQIKPIDRTYEKYETKPLTKKLTKI